MKKILGLLSAFAITTSAVSAVVACRYKVDQGNDDGDEIDKQTIRANFEADVETIIKDHLQEKQNTLMFDYDASSGEGFFNYDDVSNLSEARESEGVDVTLDETKHDKLFKNVDEKLLLTGDLKNKVNNQLREIKEYDFLLTNIDDIINSITIGNVVKLSAVRPADSDEGYTFSVAFDLVISCHFMWNGAEEIKEFGDFGIGSQIFSEELSETDIITQVQQIALNFYNQDKDFFKFTDEKIKSESNLFYDQAVNLNKWESFTDPENNNESNWTKISKKLTKALDGIADVEGGAELKFSTKTFEKGKNLYAQTVQVVPTTGGWTDMAILGKNQDVWNNYTPEQKAQALSDETDGIMNEKEFAKREASNIKNLYKIDFEDDWEFGIYGAYLFKGCRIVVNGMEIPINPVSLFYSYNVVNTNFAEATDVLMKSWKETMGITASTDPYALMKISTTTDFGKAFWADNNDVNNLFKFATTNENKSTYYPQELFKSTGVHFMSFLSYNSRTNSYAKIDSNGLAVNYWTYASELKGNEAVVYSSWYLAVTLALVTFSFRYALNPDYFNNVWIGYGLSNGGSTKYIIEKG